MAVVQSMKQWSHNGLRLGIATLTVVLAILLLGLGRP